MPRYADVILPLPLRDTYTYEVPGDAFVEHGSRVFVQFGPRKYYTGIVFRVHDTPPAGYDVKRIITVLDPDTIVRYPQIKFWEWIADYYLCSVGEVYKAALPSGLKIESETYVALRDDYADRVEDCPLSEAEARIIQTLDSLKRVKVSELAKKSELRYPAPIVSRLVEKGIISTDEYAQDRYRAKMVSVVRLAVKPDEATLHDIFDRVRRSPKQEQLLIHFLELSGVLRHKADPTVEKSELLRKSGASPAILRALAEKGILEVFKKEVNRFHTEVGEDHLSALSPIQRNALDSISAQWKEKDVVLLRGVTGSGKTEIYAHLISEALREGKQVLYLVPEISLTTQLTDRLRKIFGMRLLVYHSKFSDNERVDIWRKMLEGHEPLIVLGARSSVFLPFSMLGLVVVDEEHEASYKQYDPAPRYNARDAAILLASMHHAKVLLGSATPSVETYHKSLGGKYGLVELLERHEGGSLPSVNVVDMKKERKKKTNLGILSSRLFEATRKALAEGKQAIMFQNRRGFATTVVCSQCGWVPKCVNCDVSLVYHKGLGQLRCHYCGYSVALPDLCPACGMDGVEKYGYGTERIAEELKECFPDAKVQRMDLDTTRNKDAYQEIIDRFSRHDTDILAGTQMVSKGLDFANVRIVGVMNADTLLHYPDFRSRERAFDMLVQVAGRAGRRNECGEVVIQTTDPDNDVLKNVVSHDYLAFYNEEIEDRRRFAYPPFVKIINICLKSKDPRLLGSVAVSYTQRLRKIFGDRVLGPEAPPVGRVASYYMQVIMLKAETGVSMRKVKKILLDVYAAMASGGGMRGVSVYYDVDPV